MREKAAKDDNDEVAENESELELKYDFRFLTDEQAESKNDEENYWFKVNDILDFDGLKDINPYLLERLKNSSVEKFSFATGILSTLYEVININTFAN